MGAPLDSMASESGGNSMTIYLRNLVCGEGRLE